MRWTVAAALLAATLAAADGYAADSAVVLMYHRFGEDQYPSTNIRLEQFDAQIAELKSGGYTVLPLPEVIEAVRTGRDLPDKAVAITVDDGYASIHSEAWPRLKAAGFPFTVFIATDPVDRGLSGFMTWDQIRELKDAGVTIGAHSRTHLHMPQSDPERVRSEFAASNARFVAELGRAPTLFAYQIGRAHV